MAIATRNLPVPGAASLVAVVLALGGLARPAAAAILSPAALEAMAGAGVLAGGCEGDNDCDGVPDAVENGAPNNGDGNNDDQQDANQNDVASYPVPEGLGTEPGYLTLVVDSDCGGLYGVKPYVEEDLLPASDADFTYPWGLVAFHVTCANADVNLIYAPAEADIHKKAGSKAPRTLWSMKRHGHIKGAGTEMSYRKYAPNPVPSGPSGGSGPTGGSGPFDENSVFFTLENAEFGENSVSFHLSDGELGDNVGGDDEIRDPGGVGVPAIPAPAMPSWSIVAVALALAAAGAWRLRRETQA